MQVLKRSARLQKKNELMSCALGCVLLMLPSILRTASSCWPAPRALLWGWLSAGQSHRMGGGLGTGPPLPEHPHGEMERFGLLAHSGSDCCDGSCHGESLDLYLYGIYMEYKYISTVQGVFPHAGAAVKGWGMAVRCRQRLSELNCAHKAKGSV